MVFGLFKSKKPALPPEVADAAAQARMLAFPGGEKQIDEETGQLHALLRGKLPKAEARQLLCRTKVLLVIAQDKSEARMVPSIQSKVGNKLTQHECKIVYQFLTGIVGPVSDGNDGTTKANAVVINATSSLVGVDAEYQWLSSRFGKQNHDWSVEMRLHGEDGNRTIETFVVKLKDGTTKTVHFDISSFYGRF